MPKNIIFLSIIISSALLFSACTKPQEDITEVTDSTPVVENKQEENTESMLNQNYESFETNALEIEHNLIGVEGYTNTGSAVAKYNEVDGYQLFATVKDLPDPEGTDFYEGWIVRKSPLSVISTGRLVKVDGTYQNDFTSSDDLSDHLRYVLTLEPDDGDPAPAAHVVEGDIIFIE